MKNSVWLAVILFALSPLAPAFGQQTPPQPSIALLDEGTGAVRLRVSATGQNADEVMRQAEDLAFKTILYRGIPGASANLSKPMIGTDEAAIMAKYGPYLTTFFQERRLATFILSAVVVAGPVYYENDTRTKKDDPIGQTIDMKINLTALRSDLEQNGLIRKFGF